MNIRIISPIVIGELVSYRDNVFVVKDTDTHRRYSIGWKEVESIILPQMMKNMILLLGVNDTIKPNNDSEKAALNELVKFDAAIYEDNAYRISEVGVKLYLTQKILYK